MIPPNITPATAIEIGPLPANLAPVDVHDSGTTYTVYYKYTPVDDEWLIFFFAFGDLTTYTPVTNVLQYPNGTSMPPISYKGMQAINRSMNIPLLYNDPNGPLYFEVLPLSGNPTPAFLTVEAETAPCENAVAGDLIIPSDIAEHPITVLDRTDGHVKGYLVRDDQGNDYPPGEHGDTSNEGIFMFENNDIPGQVKLYNPDGSFWQTVNFPNVTGAELIIRSVSTSWSWLIFSTTSGGMVTIWVVEPLTITIEETITYPASTANSISASSDLRYLYIASSPGDKIKTWDRTVFGFVTSLLVSYTADFRTIDMLVFSDDSIAILFFNDITKHAIIEYYSVAGTPPVATPVNTIDFGSGWASSLSPRMTHDVFLPDTTIWIMLHNTSKFSDFRHIRVADGVVLNSFLAKEYSGGINNGSPTATPDKFGVSPSCPIVSNGKIPPDGTLILTCPNTPPVAGSGMYEMVPGKTNETLWLNSAANSKAAPSKIPNPQFKTGYIGG